MVKVNTLSWRAARGAAVAFALSFLNLAATFLALSALGSLDPWSDAQFVGLFGSIEAAMGLAYLFAPNIWRLPVAEANTGDRARIRLAASTVFVPHWIAAAKFLGGLSMVVYAAVEEGIGAATLGLPVAVLALGVAFLALSAAVARGGVERPDLDVVFIVIKRPARRDQQLPGLSLGGIVMQLLSNFGVFPAVELLSPSALYRPEIGPSPALLAATLAAAAIGCAVCWLCWHDRLAWRAPREQERELEAELSART